MNSSTAHIATDVFDIDLTHHLLSHRARACVWGLGHIGYSTAQALDGCGIRVIGCDISQARIDELSLLDDRARLTLTTDSRTALVPDVAVHFIAVPTERHGCPCDEALIEVFGSLVRAVAANRAENSWAMDPLIIIESTLTPGTVDNFLRPLLMMEGLTLGRDLFIALSPRRDWFLAEGYTLRNLDRVYSGVCDRSADLAHQVLSLFCDRLHRASNHAVGELVKCVENAFRHVEITLSNQLTLAYPDVDMVEVLRLASTKWNMGSFHPSFGTGGYCIPLASAYVLGGADRHSELSILSAAIQTDQQIRKSVADSVSGRGPVFVLGLAYKSAVKVSTLSPAIAIVGRLRELGVPHLLHDPTYTVAEIDGLLGAGVGTDDVAMAIKAAATVLIVTDHEVFGTEAYMQFLTAERSNRLLIIDNYGVLEHHVWPSHIDYHRAGDAGWLTRNRG